LGGVFLLFEGFCISKNMNVRLPTTTHPPAHTINNSFTDNYLDKQRTEKRQIQFLQRCIELTFNCIIGKQGDGPNVSM
ncbi:MAG: hypothetical protein Q4D71_08770, partial [Oscillospiraceae bacterium]|nr:hypothetical protein [Oscillospiraceae bacterium]